MQTRQHICHLMTSVAAILNLDSSQRRPKWTAAQSTSARAHQLKVSPTFTACTSLVKRETPLAFTGEASWSVLANAFRATQVDI